MSSWTYQKYARVVFIWSMRSFPMVIHSSPSSFYSFLKVCKEERMGASSSNPVPNAASFRDLNIHLREVWGASHTRGLGCDEPKIRNVLNSCNMIKNHCHQTPMKKCPTCHSKRQTSLVRIRRKCHYLPKALNKRFHQRMIHQKRSRNQKTS